MFLAIISLNVGAGSYARDADKADAIRRCKTIFEQDWGGLYDIDKKPCKVNVYDVTGKHDLHWDDRGVFDKDENPIPRLEVTEVILKGKRKR